MAFCCTTSLSYGMQNQEVQSYEAMSVEECFRTLTELREKSPRRHEDIAKRLNDRRRQELSRFFQTSLIQFVNEAFYFLPEGFKDEANALSSPLSLQQRLSIGRDMINVLGSRFDQKNPDHVFIALQQIAAEDPLNVGIYYFILENCPCYQELNAAIAEHNRNELTNILNAILTVGTEQKDLKKFVKLVCKLKRYFPQDYQILLAQPQPEIAGFLQLYNNIEVEITQFIFPQDPTDMYDLYNLSLADPEMYEITVELLIEEISKLPAQRKLARLQNLDAIVAMVDQDLTNEIYRYLGVHNTEPIRDTLVKELELDEKQEKATQRKQSLPYQRKHHVYQGKRIGQQPKRGR